MCSPPSRGLCDKNGKKVEEAKQICKYAWKGQKCRNPNCAFLHLSREEFLQQMEEGVNLHDPVASAKQLAAARAPGAAVAVPPAPAAPGSVASSYSSVTTPSSLDEARLGLLEESVKAQTEVLQKLSTDVAQLLTVSGSESDSVLQKRAEAVRKRAHLAAEMQRVEDELSSLPPAARPWRAARRARLGARRDA